MGTYRFVIGFLIAYVTFYVPSTYSTKHRHFFASCVANKCENIASEILSKLDRTVDPCDDFHKFACGGWLQHNRANLSFPKVNVFSVLGRKTENQIREMLEAPTKPGDTMSLLKARQVFAQCMNHDTVKTTKSSKAIGISNSSTTAKNNGIARAEMGASRQTDGDDTKWKKCVNNVRMNTAISHEYVKKYASHLENLENLEDIREIVTDVQSVVREQIRNSIWIDQVTKEAFLEKLEHMQFEFIKPEWYSDETIDEYYKDLNVSKPYMQNIFNVHSFERIKFSRLRRSGNTTFSPWLHKPTKPVVYYDKQENKIVVTAAFLQRPVYDSYLPRLYYGTLGFAIGYQITHAFNNNCLSDGNVTYSGKMLQVYKNITQCFINQYNDYLIPGVQDKVRVNGSLTCAANMADSAGIIAAYHAYENLKASLWDLEWRPNGFEDFSDDQIFFLIYAQFFCETVLPEQVEKDIGDVHPVQEIRIRGSLSNFRDFSRAYNCPLGTPMNPEKKCVFWL